jgi:hypothetical protein
VDPLTGAVIEIVGPVADTVSAAVLLLTLPALFLTWTQKFVVAVSAGVVKVLEFVPTGVVVVPLDPWYHW